MPFVSAYNAVGRVGHQFSQLFTAKHLSLLLPKFRYWHAPFEDGPKPGDKAAIWESFLGFGVGEETFDRRARDRNRLRYLGARTGPYKNGSDSRKLLALMERLPDDILFEIADWGIGWWESWDWPDSRFTEVADFFYQKMQASPEYQATPLAYDRVQDKLQVCVYRRTPSSFERFRSERRWCIPPTYYAGVWEHLKQQVGAENLARPILFTQSGVEDFADPLWAPFDVWFADDEYPAVFTAFKSCVECDLFIGSLGNTTGLVRTMRHERKTSIGVTGHGLYAQYPDGQNFTPEGLPA